MIEIIVPGDPEYRGANIAAEDRVHPSHIWGRAAQHIIHDLRVPYFARIEAAVECWRVYATIVKLGIPPQRAPVKWGWNKGWPSQR